jgi:hypothetical protein|tara:strand:- start:107 stop:946 length:840 start_codon:yes stop_codon:yes gene_type:complete
MTKKSKLIKDQYSSDADQNDEYLRTMEELAKDHPEIRPELHDFKIFLAGYQNGALKQVKSFYSMCGQVKEWDDELAQKQDREFLRDEFEGVDCISFKNQTIFKPNITLPKFSEFVDQMVRDGELPLGYWGDDELEHGNITYWFDKSHIHDWMFERLEEDFQRAKAVYYYEKKRLNLGMNRQDFIEYNNNLAKQYEGDAKNVEGIKSDSDKHRQGREEAFLEATEEEKKKYEEGPCPFVPDPTEEKEYKKVKVKRKVGRPKGSKNKLKHPEPNYTSKSTW